MVEKSRRLSIRSTHRAAADTAVIGFALVFICAATLKLTNLSEFGASVAQQHGLAEQLPWTLTLGVSVAQLSVGGTALWLLLMQRRSAACLTACAALTLMTLYAAWMVTNPPARPTPCGCGFTNRLYATEDWQHAALAQCLIAIGLGLLAVGTSQPVSSSPETCTPTTAT